MPFTAIDCDLSVDVVALNDVVSDSLLKRPDASQVFAELVLQAATKAVERHHIGLREDTPLLVKGVGLAAGSRLHVHIGRKGRAWRVLVVKFDFECQSLPILIDGLSIIYDEKRPVARFVAYRDSHGGTTIIEEVPRGVSVDRVAVRSSHLGAWPAVAHLHRAAGILGRWWQQIVAAATSRGGDPAPAGAMLEHASPERASPERSGGERATPERAKASPAPVIVAAIVPQDMATERRLSAEPGADFRAGRHGSRGTRARLRSRPRDRAGVPLLRVRPDPLAARAAALRREPTEPAGAQPPSQSRPHAL